MSPSRSTKSSITSQDSSVPEDRAQAGAVMPIEERGRMIAEAAYYRAEQRGFQGGDPQQDWLEAELEIGSRSSEVK